MADRKKGLGAVEPITASDAEIAKAIEDAHLPSLACASVHLTGSLDLIRSGVAPAYEFFGDGQGDLSPEDQARIRDEARTALGALREKPGEIPPAPEVSAIREMMDFIAGAEIPEHYVPFLLEELGIAGKDTREEAIDLGVAPEKAASFHTVIIGAGMSGLLAAIRLGHAGIPYTVIEKNEDVGGTWFENAYPGCRVDSPNHMYSYSFEPNHDWPQHYSTQDVLYDYFRRCADKYGVRDRIRFRTEVEEARFDEASGTWQVEVVGPDGTRETLAANAVISAVGQLNRPKMPDLPGIDSFAGPSFHSAEWEHSVDLAGKKVIVIGTGASAFQFIPEIAPTVGEMTVFQRTPPWLGPTPDYHDDVSDGQKWLLKHMPYYAEWYRFWLFWMMTDGIYPAAQSDPAWNQRDKSISAANEELRVVLTDYIRAQVEDDPDLIDKAVPNYYVGGKRMLRDNGVWFAALKRPNVNVVTERITEVVPEGVKTADGALHKADVIIYGTGFQASRFLTPMKIHGRNGIELNQQWQGDARAYLGITVPNFPNFFLMYGPNTNIVVNGSIIFFSECEMRYILGCLKLLLKNGQTAMEPKRDVHDAFNEKIDALNEQMAWGQEGVSSWYKNENGRVAQNWPLPLVDYWQATKAPDPADFEFR